MSTEARLVARAADLATEYECTFEGITALRNVAYAPGEGRKLGILGGNNAGKSTLINLNIQVALVEGDDAYRARGGDQPPALALLACHYNDQAEVDAALQDSKLAMEDNPRPLPDVNGVRHLQHVAKATHKYHEGVRGRFGRAENALLLPVGNIVETTTQAVTYVRDGSVVGCIIFPRPVEALTKAAEEVLQDMLSMAQEENDDVELCKKPDFSELVDQYKELTGTDVVEKSSAERCTLEATLQQEVLDWKGGRSLLREDVQQLAALLKPSAFIGLRRDLGSDLLFVKDVLHKPLEALIRVCCNGEDVPHELLEPSVVGMLIEKTEVMVPCPTWGSVQLVDMPGLNDTKPWSNHNIKQAIASCTDVLLLSGRSLTADRTMLQCLIDTCWAAGQLDPNAQGHLLFCHNPERCISGFHAVELWDSQYNKTVEDIRKTSWDEMRKWLLQKVAPKQLPLEEKQACVDRFMGTRFHTLSVAVANCISLMQSDPQEVYAWLKDSDDNIELDGDVNFLKAYNRLLERTQVADFQEFLARISRFRSAQHMEAMVTEVNKQMQNLVDSAEAADVLTTEQAREFGPMLKAKLTEPSRSDDYLKAAKAFQPGRRGQPGSSHTMADVAAWLGQKLKTGALQSLVQHYEQVVLTDGGIDSAADQVVGLLQGAEQLDVQMLRRICRNSALWVPRAPDMLATLRAMLLVTKSQLCTERADDLLQLHRKAAADLAEVLKYRIDTFFTDESLQKFLLTDRMWRKLVGRIEDELLRVARHNLVEGNSFNEAIGELLREKLSERLRPLSGFEIMRKRIQRKDCWGHVRNAIVVALRTMRDKLPELLERQLTFHVESELFSENKLFMPVRSRSHGLARKEMGRQSQADDAAQAGDVADSTQQGAERREGAVPPTPVRMRRSDKIAMQYERQASLWRAFYRFLRDAHSTVVGQEAENALMRKNLLQELEALHADLEAAVQMCRGGDGHEELRQMMGRSLLHSMLQHKLLAQVLADSPEVTVQAKPLSFKVQLVQLPNGSTAVHGATFIAVLGDLRLPAWQRDDMSADSIVMLITVLKQQHQLMWEKKHPVPYGPNNALKAAYASLTGRRLDTDNNLKTIRNIVTKQMFEEGMDALAKKLESTGLLPAPVDQQAALSYNLASAGDTQVSGLLELQELAIACLKPDEAFLVWSTERVDGGRFRAYLLPATPLSTTGPAQREIKAFALTLFGRMGDGLVRPMFEPVFWTSREAMKLLEAQLSQLSEGEGRGKRARTTCGTIVGDSSQPTFSTTSGKAGPSSAAGGSGAPRSVSQRTRALQLSVEEDVAEFLANLCRTAGGQGGPPDTSDEAGPSKRERR